MITSDSPHFLGYLKRWSIDGDVDVVLEPERFGMSYMHIWKLSELLEQLTDLEILVPFKNEKNNAQTYLMNEPNMNVLKLMPNGFPVNFEEFSPGVHFAQV